VIWPFRSKPKLPPVIDRREWNEDWQRGDLAKCIADDWDLPPNFRGYTPIKGRTYRVEAAREASTWDGRSLIVGLVLESCGGNGFVSTHFRKLRPSLTACDETFAVELRDRLKGKPVREFVQDALSHNPETLESIAF
jgi:hypothetical protein